MGIIGHGDETEWTGKGEGREEEESVTKRR